MPTVCTQCGKVNIENKLDLDSMWFCSESCVEKWIHAKHDRTIKKGGA